MSSTTTNSWVGQTRRLSQYTQMHLAQEKLKTTHTGTPVGAPLTLQKASSNMYPPKMPFKTPQPIIKKLPNTSRRRPFEGMKSSSAKLHATELESKLESSLEVAAGGISTMMKNLIARHNSEATKDEQLSQYIARLGAISEELKNQLETLGISSKLASQQDQKSFSLSYRRVLALWNEYQRISACIIQRARIWKQSKRKSTNNLDDSPGSPSVSNSSISSEVSTSSETRK